MIRLVLLITLIDTPCLIDTTLASTGEEIIINSGQRSIAHNNKVGGVKNSRHLKPCEARDINKAKVRIKTDFVQRMIKQKFRVIEYPNHYHIDTGKPGHLYGRYKK